MLKGHLNSDHTKRFGVIAKTMHYIKYSHMFSTVGFIKLHRLTNEKKRAEFDNNFSF